MYELKTNTAVRIAVGPLVDPTDFKTAETGLTVTGLVVEIYQMDGTGGGAVTRASFSPTASGGNNDMIHISSDTAGMYDLELTASQLNWLGSGRITFYDIDGFIVHWIDIQVVSAAYYDWKYGSTIPNVNVTQISGDGTAADNLESYCDGTTPIPANATQISGDAAAADNAESFFDGTGYAGTNNVIPTVTASGLSAAAVDAIWDEVVTSGHATAGSAGKLMGDNLNAPVATVDTVVDGIATQIGAAGAGLSAVPWNAAWDAEVESEANDALVALNLDHLCKVATAGADMTTEVVDNSILSRVLANGDTSAFDPSTDALQLVRDEIVVIDGIVDAILVDTGTTLDGKIDTIDGNVDSILADTNELQTDWHDGGRLDLLLDGASAPSAADVADAVWDEALAGHAGAGSAGEALAAAGTAGDPWTTALPGAYGAGTAGKIVGDNLNAPVATVDTVVDGIYTAVVTNAAGADVAADIIALKAVADDILTDTGTTLDGKINTIDDFLDTEVAAILADTNELQTDLTNGGRLDLLIDAIKAKTDNLPASPAAVGSAMTLANGAITAAVIATDAIDADALATDAVTEIKNAVADQVWDEAATGHTDAGKAGAQLWTDIDAILEDTGTTLPAAIDAVPTAAEIQAEIEENGASLLDTIRDTLGTAGAGLTAVPWNAVWDAEVQSECTDALNAYDPPTKAEMDTAIDAIPTVAEIKTGMEAAGGHLALILEDTGTTLDGKLNTIDDFLDTEVAAILADTNELQTDWVNGGRLDLLIDAIKAVLDKLDTSMELDGAVYRFTANALEEGASGAATSIFSTVVEGAMTFEGAMRLLLSLIAGKASGGGTTTVVFRDIGDTKNRITLTVDAKGNRSAVVTNVS
jgi:hypothetical protein